LTCRPDRATSKLDSFDRELPKVTKVGSTRGLTATTLLALAGLHVLWGLGFSFSFRDREQLADSVVGTSEVPSFGACLAVATALALAAALVTGLFPLPGRIRTFALRVASSILLTRGIAGAVGRTSVLSPGSESATFKRLDKKIYSPLCLWLATSVRRSI
jgi:hypothetical protein